MGSEMCIRDRLSIVFIQDVLIFPAYQRQGIGTMLFGALMERYPEVYQMELAADDTLESAAFYQSLGFRRDRDIGCCAFMKM